MIRTKWGEGSDINIDKVYSSGLSIYVEVHNVTKPHYSAKTTLDTVHVILTYALCSLLY